MAIIGLTVPQLIDAHKNSEEGAVIELLNQYNPVLDDAIARECNNGATHRSMIRTGLPSTAWGRLYKGIPQSKATLQQVDDTTGFRETRSEVDVRLLKLSSDPARERLTAAAPYIEALAQDAASDIFYSDTATTPEGIKGLGARYAACGTRDSTDITRQVIDAGGSNNANTSIWFVTWSDFATTLLYPKGTKAGISHEDKGEQRVLDTAGNPYYVKESVWTWHYGMCVGDWRYNARIANIDVEAALDGDVDLYELMTTAYYRLQSRRRDAKSARLAIYMNSAMLEVLDKLASGIGDTGVRTPLRLTPKEIEGKEVLTWRGIPIRECDAILNTEANVPSA